MQLIAAMGLGLVVPSGMPIGSAAARDEAWTKRIGCEHTVKYDKPGECAAYTFAIDQYATHWVMSCSAASGGPKGHGTTWSAERRGPGTFGSEGDNPPSRTMVAQGSRGRRLFPSRPASVRGPFEPLGPRQLRGHKSINDVLV